MSRLTRRFGHHSDSFTSVEHDEGRLFDCVHAELPPTMFDLPDIQRGVRLGDIDTEVQDAQGQMPYRRDLQDFLVTREPKG